MTEAPNYNLSAVEDPISCCYCNKTFPDKESLEIHEVFQHFLFKFRCTKQDCAMTFIREEYLKKHVLVYHTSKIKKPYKCTTRTECIEKRIAFRTEGELNQHLKRHGPKKHVCTLCKKSFAMKSYLKAHYRSHTGEKPYQCGKCEKCFSTTSSRTYHESHVHM
jgi:uncharacterized Zn-finger protein